MWYPKGAFVISHVTCTQLPEFFSHFACKKNSEKCVQLTCDILLKFHSSVTLDSHKLSSWSAASNDNWSFNRLGLNSLRVKKEHHSQSLQSSDSTRHSTSQLALDQRNPLKILLAHCALFNHSRPYSVKFPSLASLLITRAHIKPSPSCLKIDSRLLRNSIKRRYQLNFISSPPRAVCLSSFSSFLFLSSLVGCWWNH
jgi:hypothetical protein